MPKTGGSTKVLKDLEGCCTEHMNLTHIHAWKITTWKRRCCLSILAKLSRTLNLNWLWHPAPKATCASNGLKWHIGNLGNRNDFFYAVSTGFYAVSTGFYAVSFSGFFPKKNKKTYPAWFGTFPMIYSSSNAAKEFQVHFVDVAVSWESEFATFAANLLMEQLILITHVGNA